MAAREHQGLQIALIIFVMLTIVLGVTTFVFFNNYKDEHVKALDQQKNSQKAAEDLRAAVDEMSKLKKFMGYGDNDALPAIEANFTKDMEMFGKGLPETKQDYRFVISDQNKQLRDAKGRIVDDEQREQELKNELTTNEGANKEELKRYHDSLDQAKKDLEQRHGQFESERQRLTKADAALAKRVEDKEREKTEETKKLNDELQATVEKLQKMTLVNEDYKKKTTQEDINAEVADGRVTWVNQRARIIWINLGIDDGLRRQISFEVFGPDENNPLKAVKKGSVEVTRVLDHHLSEARIMDDNPSNPIMPSDNVFSIAWEPGRAEHFALVGFMDFDGDKVSDRKLIKDVITSNGGVIDAELKDDGTREGDMTVHTRYLVLGEEPTDKKSEGVFRENFTKMVKEAKALPIKTISVQQLFDYMGYEAHEQTVPLGEDSRASDFRPRMPEGASRRNPNSMFKPRKTMSSNQTKTAY